MVTCGGTGAEGAFARVVSRRSRRLGAPPLSGRGRARRLESGSVGGRRVGICLLLLAGSACTSGARERTYYDCLDLDDDGWYVGSECAEVLGLGYRGYFPSDCDDADPERHPDASELCDGIDNDCSGRTDDNPVGSLEDCETGMPSPCEDGYRLCESARWLCQPRRTSTVEPVGCNGLDDDCDGETDEGAGRDETCNGADDDCDGETDEDFACPAGSTVACWTTCSTPGTGPCTDTCMPPGPASCVPDGEVCNGIDDDCDRRTDEDFPCARGVAMNCVTRCGTTGSGICSASCALPATSACTPPDETCNGRDDDCDGETDEDFACVRGGPTSCTTTCYSTGSGACSASCTVPTGSACTPPVETCNGRDDDCDGERDEGFACIRGSTTPCTTSCGTTGTRLCGTGCVPEAECRPPVERCDGVDDDCDGRTDEGAWCLIDYGGRTTTLRAVAFAGIDEGWAVGENGLILRYDGTDWWKSPSGTTENLLDVAVLRPGDAWVVGENATALHWDGVAWDSPATPCISGAIRGAVGMPPAFAMIVGDEGRACTWDGSVWTPVGPPVGGRFNAIWGSAPDSVWIAGADGVVQFWNGSGLAPQAISAARDFHAAGPVTATLPFLAGDLGMLYVRSGTSWLPQSSRTTEPLYGAPDRFAAAPRIVGQAGTIVAYDDFRWVTHVSGTTATLYDVDYSYAGEYWAVGEAGEMRRETPAGWESGRVHGAPFLVEIWGSGPDDVWAVGLYGRTVHWDGDRWRTIPNAASRSDPPITLTGVHGSAADDVWFVGHGGVVMRWDGDEFDVLNLPVASPLHSVWSPDRDRALVVGGDGTTGAAWFRNGGTWHDVSGGDTGHLNSVWGAAFDDAWAVGAYGLIRRWNGTAWSTVASPTGEHLYFVHGTASDDVWAVGAYGVVLHWDGAAWTLQDITTPSSIANATVFAEARDSVWITRASGSILRWNGAYLTTSGTLSPEPYAVWGSAADGYWAVGASRSAYRMIP